MSFRETLLNESRTSCNTQTSEERDYYELNSLIYRKLGNDNTNSIIHSSNHSHLDSLLSITKIDKSNSMLSNSEIWDVNKNQDNATVFYTKIKEYEKKRRGLTNKRQKQLEDYNDDVEERVDAMKTDQIQQISANECNVNNLKQINCIYDENSVNPKHLNELYNKEQAKYYTPTHLRFSVANNEMNVSIAPRQLFFPLINQECEDTKTQASAHWNSHKKAGVLPNSKFDYPFQAYPNYSYIKNGFNGTQMGDPLSAKPLKGANEVVSPKINIEDIIIGKDKRTTLMLRNIPNKYTLSNILEEISSSFWGKYDFINLPIDNERKLNLGYAFINFTDPLHIILFYDTYRAKKWLKHKSDKKMDMNYADKQGKRENNGKDTQNYYVEEDKRFNLATLQIKTEIPVKHLDFFKKIYPTSVCVVEDKNSLYNDKCFVIKSIGKK